MISRYVRRGTCALAIATWWSFAAVSVVGAGTMPTPDEPQETGDAVPVEEVAPPVVPTDGPAAPDEETGVVADETQTGDAPSVLASPSPAGVLRPPIEGIRRHTEVVGEVVGHPTGKVLMAVRDVVTLKLDRSENLKPHDVYAIGRREQFVEHPDSGRNMGYVIRVVATAELEQSFGRYWSARIVSSTDYVTLDDWVLPFEAATESVGEAPSDLTGSIVAVRDGLLLASEASVVYTDLGAELGVKPGDVFSIVRPGSVGRRGGPDRSIGVLRILAIQPTSSSAYLTKSIEPVMVGDRVEHALSGTAVQ